MSGAYIVQGKAGDDLDALAPLLAGQIAYGGETVNHYAVSGATLMGLVSRDQLGQGVMPRYLESQGLWGVLQGELYASDARDSAQSKYGDSNDLAMLASIYRDGKLADVLPSLNGAFFVVFWDPQSEALVCANDRYGLYPMYWSHGNGRFCLADRGACSVIAGTVEGALDPNGAALLLTIDDYAGETTLIRGVSTYPQATILTKQGGRLDWARYWHYDFTPRPVQNADDTAREIGDRFVEAVRRQCKTGRRIGVTLSGGLDSRCIVAAASKADIPVHTFTWGKAGAFDRDFAKKVANHFGAEHHDCDYEFANFETRYHDGCRMAEGLLDYFDCHMLAHLHRMDGNVDLILNGYAGDVILGGSFLRAAWMQNLPVDDVARRIFGWRNSLLAQDRLAEAMPADAVPAGVDLPSARFHNLMEPLADLPTPDLVDRFILENRQRRVTAMGTVLLRSVVESTACFFDYDLMDLECSVPASLRFEHRIYMKVMRQTFPDTLKLPWQRTLLPAGAPEWMSVPSKAFLKAARLAEKRIGWPRVGSRQSPVAFGEWLRGPLRAWMEGVCMDSASESESVLRADFCRRIWEEHLAGQDRTRHLGVIASIRGFGRVLRDARNSVRGRDVEPVRVNGGDNP